MFGGVGVGKRMAVGSAIKLLSDTFLGVLVSSITPTASRAPAPLLKPACTGPSQGDYPLGLGARGTRVSVALTGSGFPGTSLLCSLFNGGCGVFVHFLKITFDCPCRYFAVALSLYSVDAK